MIIGGMILQGFLAQQLEFYLESICLSSCTNYVFRILQEVGVEGKLSNLSYRTSFYLLNSLQFVIIITWFNNSIQF